MREITVAAAVESIPRVTEWIDEALEGFECPMKAQAQLDVAIDEILSNIARYAYPEGPGEATVRYEYDPSRRRFAVEFLDQGEPFDPLAQAEPDTALPAGEREIGGLGIFLVKKTMDDARYRYQDGRNILRLEKTI